MNEQEIRRLFERDEGRPPRPGYWDEIQARLEAVDAERAAPGSGRSDPGTEATEANMTSVTDTDVTFIRPSNMNSNDNSRSTQRNLFLAAAAVLVVALIGAGLVLRSAGDDDTTGVASDDTSEQVDDTAASTATTRATTGDSADTTAGDDGPDLVNEAEDGLRYDYGIVERMEEVDGTVWIWFDRAGFGEEQLAGLDHQVEPRYELASDWHGGENTNSRLRTFPLADDADILLLNPVAIEEVCAGGQAEEPFEAFTPGAVLADGWQELTVSLTFNDSGEVTAIRDQTSC